MAKLGACVSVLVVLFGLATPAHAQEEDDSGHLELTLHGRLSDSSELEERAAWLTLNVPFDRLAWPRLLARETAPSNKVELTLPDARADPSAAVAPTVAADVPALTFAQLQTFASFSTRATRAALAVVGAAAERRRLDGLASRSRASALLPELRLRAQRNTDQALRLAPVTDDPYRATQADGAGTMLEASATFRLDRLVFTNAELVIERLRQRAGEERLALEQRVTSSLLALFRARELVCLDGTSDETRALQRLALFQLFTELDLLTGGWFGQQAPGLGRALWGFPEAVLGACQPPAATKPVASLDDSE
jgi:hypothetical protein